MTDGGFKVVTVEDVFRDFLGRRAGLIKALTTDLGKLYDLCDPNKENLCLYGRSNETWEVNLPAEEVPPEIPEPVLGINFARDGMPDREWRTLVAVHSDLWLLSVAFYYGGRLLFSKADRKRLFTMINDLPTLLEEVSGQAKKQTEEKPSASNQSSNKSKSNSKVKIKNYDFSQLYPSNGDNREESQRKHPKTPPKPNYEDDEGLEEEVDDDDTLCGACEQNDSSDEFWIFCDFCEKWFHGMCVKITPAQAEYIKQYKCPLCSSTKRARP